MNEFEDYDLIIEDLESPEPKDVTKPQLIKILNERLSKSWIYKSHSGEIEIDVKPEWKKILENDGSIIEEYRKLGWEVWHYILGEDGCHRRWLSFKNPNYKGTKK